MSRQWANLLAAMLMSKISVLFFKGENS